MKRKYFVTIVVVLFLASFQSQKESINYQLNISYTELISPSQIIYEVNESELKVYEQFYSPNSDSTIYYNSHLFQDFDQVALKRFLHSIDWLKIPNELITPAIDGFHLDIELKIKNENYSFHVENTYHPTIDSLLILCNEMIPNKRTKKEYKIYYRKTK